MNTYPLYKRLCLSKGQNDEKVIEESYGQIMKDKKRELKEKFRTLGKNFDDFEENSSKLQADLKQIYLSSAPVKNTQPPAKF